MHILGAKQINNYISNRKVSVYRVEARLLNLHSRSRNAIDNRCAAGPAIGFLAPNISRAGSAANRASSSHLLGGDARSVVGTCCTIQHCMAFI
jgi:hypothetical protein